MNVEVIRIDGTREHHIISVRSSSERLRECHRLIGVDCADRVNLKDGRVMIVDDTGLLDGKPVNPAATRLYHSVCKPGTTHPICGDVVIVWDKDFA